MRRLHLLLPLGAFALIWGSPSPAAADCLVVTPCPPPVAPEDPPPADEPPAQEPAPPAEEPADPAPAPAPAPAPGSTDDAGADRLLELVNEERRRAGVPPLTRRADVDRIAVEHSRRMAAADRIWHNDAYFTSETRTRLGARALGENVALNASVEDAHRRLMASPGHRRNILSATFSVVGIGVVRGESSWFLTQNFVEPRAQAAPAAARQTAAATPPSPSRARVVAAVSATPAVAIEATTAASPAMPSPTPAKPDPADVRLSRGAAAARPGANGATGPGPAPVMVAASAVIAAGGLLQRSQEAWR